MLTEFKPHKGNKSILRDALSCFVSSLTIVKANSPKSPLGVTANSFSSPSPSPLFVIWLPYIGIQRFTLFKQAENFAIHMLSAIQEHLGNYFARSPFAFRSAEITFSDFKMPLIGSCIPKFGCKKTIYFGNGHNIVVGESENAQMRNGGALIVFPGQFREAYA